MLTDIYNISYIKQIYFIITMPINQLKCTNSYQADKTAGVTVLYYFLYHRKCHELASLLGNGAFHYFK